MELELQVAAVEFQRSLGKGLTVMFCNMITMRFLQCRLWRTKLYNELVDVSWCLYPKRSWSSFLFISSSSPVAEADLAESSSERWSLLAPISVLGITGPEHFKLSIHHDIIDINTWPSSEKYIWSDLSRNPLSLRSCHNSGSGDLGHQACHLLGRGHLQQIFSASTWIL